MASVNKAIFVGRLASAATTFRSVSQWKVYSQPIVAKKFNEPINATTVIKVELVCVMKKVAMLRSLLDEFCGSGGLSELDFAADKRGKTKAVPLSAIGLILIGQLRPFAACAKVSFTASTILLPALSASMSSALCSRRGVELTLDRVMACATPRSRSVLRRAGWSAAGYSRQTVRARLFSPARGWCFAGL